MPRFHPALVALTTLPAAGLLLGSSGSGESAGVRAAAPTYAADVAPILRAQCVHCHRPGGSAPFSLVTYDDARVRAGRIARATAARVMPPWLPRGEPGTFEGERRLTPQQIGILEEWAAEGAPAGDLGALGPPPDVESGWALGPPDLVVRLPAYELAAEGYDVYRNLVVAIPVGETRWVESVELRPGDPRVVHHARMMVDTTRSSRDFDAEDTAPGFDGMDVRSNATNPDGHFVGWTPGKVVLPPLEGMAWRLDPGTDLVAQLHMRTTGEPEVVEGEVGFYFADAPPTRAPAIVVVSAFEIDIPPGVSDYRVSHSYRLPVPVDVLSVYPHAHYLGKELRALAVLPNGREVTLIDVPDWDFNWQDDYRFRRPVSLPAGALVTLEYSFDNSAANPRNPNDPPRRVVYGSGSTDEMADLILQVLPRNADERRTLLEDQAWAHQAQNLAYVANRAYERGRAHLEGGELDAAIAAFREALQNRTDHVQALVGLSRAFALGGDAEAALLIARQGVLHSAGGDPWALDALAAALAGTGERGAAVDAAERALAIARRIGEAELADSLRVRIERYRR